MREKLAVSLSPELTPPSEAVLLGWGFAITEFLTAPTLIAGLNRAQICSLGGLVNLIVVASDRLLDSGHGIEPPTNSTAESGSPLQQLQSRYFSSLAALNLEEPLSRMTARAIPLMYEAEIATTRQEGCLPHKLWLRKCCLPFVVMALPACGKSSLEGRELSFRYLNWLYRVGRFLGAVDDATDYSDDVEATRPNYFNESKRTRPAAMQRIAGWGFEVLREWDRFVPRTCESEISRETFLHTVWGW